MTNIRRFLFYFAQELMEFRRPEMESISKLFNINVELPKNDENKPYWILQDINEDQAKLIASRSVLLRYCAEIWTSGKSFDEFHEKLRKYPVDGRYKTSSFKFRVETFNNHISHATKIDKIENISYLKFEGKIDLKSPENEFLYFEYYGLDPMNVPEEPYEIFMGRILQESARDLIKTISLKNRKFIGNTSMDPQMSLIMANQAMCDKNQLCFDPFCGTGSLLIAAAKFNSFVIGMDIDYLMLHAKTRPSRIQQKVREKDESVKANMEQYSLSHLYLDVLVGDFANCPLIDTIEFDSIICDPPYGIREAMSKLERKDQRKPQSSSSQDTIHFPSLSNYKIKHLYDDLLTYSFKHLKMGGRLVCFFPCLKETYNDNMIPQHSALKLVANTEQNLQADASRRLLTYEKISETGKLIENKSLEDVDFREEFFAQLDRKREKQERSEKIKQHNLEETAKRGINLPNIYEYKKNCNKKRLKESK